MSGVSSSPSQLTLERFSLPHPSLRPPADSPPPGVCARKRCPRPSLRVLSQAAPGQAMAEATACLGASDLLVCRESPESTEDLEVEVPAVPVRAGAGRSHYRGPGAGLCPNVPSDEDPGHWIGTHPTGLCKDPISICHVLRYRGLGFQHEFWGWEGTQFNP